MAVIKQGGNTIKVVYITDLTGPDNKVLKKNVKGTLVMNLTDILVVDVYYNNKVQIDPAKCRIFHEQLGWMILNESFEDISHLKMDGTIQVKGFTQRKKSIKNKSIKNERNTRQRNIGNS